jgi:hypothetical protein
MRRIFLSAFLMLLASACDAAGGAEGERGTTHEVVDGIERVTSSGLGLWGADTVRAQVVGTIGEIEGNPGYLFGDITAVAVDGQGRLYVTDRIGSTLRAYDADGVYLSTLATEGEGPGELMWPTGLTFGANGDLLVRDRVRITRLAADAGGLTGAARDTWPAPVFASATTRRSRIDPDGAYLHPHERHSRDAPSEHFYLVYRGEEATDTVPVPPYDGFGEKMPFVRTGPGGGRMVQDLAHMPFAARPTWDLTHRGTVLSSGGASYRLVETDARGDTVQIIERREEPRAIPDRILRDSLRAVERRIEELPVPLAQVENISEDVRERRLGDHYPAVRNLYVAEDGRIWVERWPPAARDAETFFDVFSAGADFLGSIHLPVPLQSSPPPWIGEVGIVGVVVDPDFDVQRVVTLSFNDPTDS